MGRIGSFLHTTGRLGCEAALNACNFAEKGTALQTVELGIWSSQRVQVDEMHQAARLDQVWHSARARKSRSLDPKPLLLFHAATTSLQLRAVKSKTIEGSPCPGLPTANPPQSEAVLRETLNLESTKKAIPESSSRRSPSAMPSAPSALRPARPQRAVFLLLRRAYTC